MPLQIVRNDITKMKVDAIVNAANSSLLGGGGVDGCIHRAAGPELLAQCRALGGCKTGSAKITGAGKLPCRYVIHAVGPQWQGGSHGERQLLTSCYRTALKLAWDYRCQTVAFPLISSGIYGYPKDQALQVAVDTIRQFLLENEMLVYLVIFDKSSFQIGQKRFADIAAYIDDQYVEAHTDSPALQQRRAEALFSPEMSPKAPDASLADSAPAPDTSLVDSALAPDTSIAGPSGIPAPAFPAAGTPGTTSSLSDALNQLDESFSEMLLRKIDEKGMKDSECYKKANIDRKLFSKIRSDRLYRPSKPTVLAFAIALELPLAETREMLQKAGFALSHSHKFDIIVEYFIAQGNYNIFEINEALFAFDQSLLGA